MRARHKYCATIALNTVGHNLVLSSSRTSVQNSDALKHNNRF